jgi:hypothetical protein
MELEFLMSDENDKVFCKWELTLFPREQFKEYLEYGLVHEHPPDGAPKHTVSGQPLPEEEVAVTTWSVPSQSSSH